MIQVIWLAIEERAESEDLWKSNGSVSEALGGSAVAFFGSQDEEPLSQAEWTDPNNDLFGVEIAKRVVWFSVAIVHVHGGELEKSEEEEEEEKWKIGPNVSSSQQKGEYGGVWVSESTHMGV